MSDRAAGRTGSGARRAKLALVAGYLALAAAVLVAHRHPATGYELSIYAATPAATWAGIVVAVVVGAVVALTGPRERHGGGVPGTRARGAGVLLATLAVLTVFAMPELRGYYYYGIGDAMSHLGWAREMANGSLHASGLLYPGIHVGSVLVSRVAGVRLMVAMMAFVLVVFPAIFVLFTGLSARLLAGVPRAFTIGALAALPFTPLNNISIHAVAHPASQSIYFFPALTYVAFAYLLGRADRNGPVDHDASLSRFRFRPSGFGALFALFSLTMVLLHPQQALNAALLLGSVAGLQVLVRRFAPGDALADHRPLFGQAAFLVAVWLAWAPRFPRVQGETSTDIMQVLVGQGIAGESIGSKSVSLTTIGGSLPGLFAKLFLSAAVLAALAACLFGLSAFGRSGDRDTGALARGLALGLVPVALSGGVLFLASTGTLYFRYVGFIMAPVTLVGAAALARWLAWTDPETRRRIARVGIVVVLVVLLPVSLYTIHDSPYIYEPNQQATQGQVTGYGAAFDHRDPGVRWVGTRGGPRRYVDLHYGTHYARKRLDFPGYKYGIVNESVFRNRSYASAFDGPRYFSVLDAGRQLEVGVYHGLRYPASGYRALDVTPGVNRVQASRDLDIYYLSGGRGV